MIWQFYCFCYLAFSTPPFESDTFSMSNSIPILWFYILSVRIRVSSPLCINSGRKTVEVKLQGGIFHCFCNWVRSLLLQIVARVCLPGRRFLGRCLPGRCLFGFCMLNVFLPLLILLSSFFIASVMSVMTFLFLWSMIVNFKY